MIYFPLFLFSKLSIILSFTSLKKLDNFIILPLFSVLLKLNFSINEYEFVYFD